MPIVEARHARPVRHHAPAVRSLQRRAADAARAGLDFLVAHQRTDELSADHGRFPFVFDCCRGVARSWTTNWLTGVLVEALLVGHRHFGEGRYLDAARRGVAYIKSLQEFSPGRPKMYGAFHEDTPQSVWMHPRDGLTAAWALFDWARATGDGDAMTRAEAYGRWFVEHALHKGYPCWTARFDDEPWDPRWYGSFHSGGAFFLARLYEATGDDRFRRAMRSILAHYNEYHLDEAGRITVIRDHETLQRLDGTQRCMWTTPNWELMHVYNDDFGALANLAAYRLEDETGYRDAAERFLRRMIVEQRDDGGFGPDGLGSIPSAGGAVLLELQVAAACGLDLDADEAAAKAASYLMGLQQPAGTPGAGAFLGFSDDYRVDPATANTRSCGYAILALLRFAGAVDPCYFFDD